MRIQQSLTLGSTLLAMILAAPAALAGQDHQQTGQSAGMSRSEPGAHGAQSSASSVIAVDELEDRKVVNSNGDEIGEVDEIVRGNQDNQLHAVVEVGGFMGMGAKEVTIPLSELKMQNDALVAPQMASTQEQLKALPKYDESQFTELSEDQRIEKASFAAFESAQQPGQQGQGMESGSMSQQRGQEQGDQGGSTNY